MIEHKIVVGIINGGLAAVEDMLDTHAAEGWRVACGEVRRPNESWQIALDPWFYSYTLERPCPTSTPSSAQDTSACDATSLPSTSDVPEKGTSTASRSRSPSPSIFWDPVHRWWTS